MKYIIVGIDSEGKITKEIKGLSPYTNDPVFFHDIFQAKAFAYDNELKNIEIVSIYPAYQPKE